MKRRVVILYGAGAAIDFGGPCTSELTRRLLDVWKNLALSTPAPGPVELIQRYVQTSQNVQSPLNFENYIGAIEEIVAVFEREKTSPPRNSYPIQILQQFKVEMEDVFRNTDTTKIWTGEFSSQWEGTIPFYNPDGSFDLPKALLILLRECHNDILGRTTQYRTTITTERNNSNYINWINQLLQQSSIIRQYSLNYDHHFYDKMKQAEIDCFDGFHSLKDSMDSTVPDVARIISDYECNSFYHLHGSANWAISEENPLDFNAPQIMRTYSSFWRTNDSKDYSIAIDDGTRMYYSTIISGYKKTLKLNFTPFRQFNHAFERDTYFADELIVIGYSFRDLHINDVVRYALEVNKKVKVSWVAPEFEEKSHNTLPEFYRLIFSVFPGIGTMEGFDLQSLVGSKIPSACGGRIKGYGMTFAEYLANQV